MHNRKGVGGVPGPDVTGDRLEVRGHQDPRYSRGCSLLLSHSHRYIGGVSMTSVELCCQPSSRRELLRCPSASCAAVMAKRCAATRQSRSFWWFECAYKVHKSKMIPLLLHEVVYRLENSTASHHVPPTWHEGPLNAPSRQQGLMCPWGV